MIYKNKKGEMVLRDIIFMMVIFSGVMIFASLFVNDMADGYGNTNMSAEFAGTEVAKEGSSLFYGLQKNISIMTNETEKGINEGGTGIVGTLKSAWTIIMMVVKSPIYFGNAITAALNTLMIPAVVATPVGIIISLGLYVLIIFTIISLFSSGSSKA